jgi:hypothetical protein
MTADNARFVDILEADGKRQAQIATEPFPSPPVLTYSAEDGYKAVLAAVGACLPARDAADARIVQEVRDRKGAIIDSQNQVGGWPELKSAPASIDSDHDGIPDEWETRNGLDPKDPADGNADPDKDGYTNLEEYLNNTDPKGYIDYREPKNNVDALTAPLLKTALGNR